MTAKEFVLNKINNEWQQDFRDTNADNIEELSKAFDEFAENLCNQRIEEALKSELAEFVLWYDNNAWVDNECYACSGKYCESIEEANEVVGEYLIQNKRLKQ